MSDWNDWKRMKYTRSTNVNRPEIGLCCNQLNWIESDKSAILRGSRAVQDTWKSNYTAEDEKKNRQKCCINICLPSISRHQLRTSIWIGLFRRIELSYLDLTWQWRGGNYGWDIKRTIRKEEEQKYRKSERSSKLIERMWIWTRNSFTGGYELHSTQMNIS